MANETANEGVPSTDVGGHSMYIDNTGGLHSTPAGAIAENMRTEGDFSRGTSGGCTQDPANVPDNWHRFSW